MTLSKPRILFVDDETALHEPVQLVLADDYEVKTKADGSGALEVLRRDGPFDLVLLDINMPGMSGLEALAKMVQFAPDMPVVMITGMNQASLAVQALQSGAREFLHKPISIEELRVTVGRILRDRAAVAEAVKPGLPEVLVGSSAAMQQVGALLQKLADCDTTVLIKGETGTGKELVARALHARSARRCGAFVALHCTTIPADSLGSELFGHESDVFAEAAHRRIGFFEAASGGTLFFDEIGEMPLAVQGKVLRAVEEGGIRRLGGEHTIPINTRLVFATNRDLDQEVRRGTFRKELYYRINVVTVTLPPLRDRREDIPELVAHFVGRFAEQLNRPAPQFTRAAMQWLAEHPWPGNVRELKHAIERLMVTGDAPRISALDLETVLGEATPVRGE